ncbi:MAG: DUF4173 domain-containing protein [Oscillochloris sp.]|nr:DUF4173 domain-containing protein [Oscillochloris sp.]
MTSLRAPHILLIAALLLGVCADLLFYGRQMGISVPLFVALGLMALLAVSRAEGRPGIANRWVGAVALSFAGWLAIRAEPMLVFLNSVALLCLLLLLTVGFHSDALYRLPLIRLISRTFRACFEITIYPVTLAVQQLRQLPLRRIRIGRLTPVLRGALLAAPLLLIFSGLLMAADQIFASYLIQIFTFQMPFDMVATTNHTIIVGCFTWLVAGGLIVAMDEGLHAVPTLPAEGETERLASTGLSWRFLGSTEAITVLFLLNLLFAGFMAVQGAYFFGGFDTLARTGLSYAEYARRGFFELLTVAFLTLGLLCTLTIITHRESATRRQIFNIVNLVLVLLVLGILVSAFQRMWLYELAYGFTRLRLYTHSFMIWLAVVLLLFVIALLTARPQIFLSGGFASALIYLTILNIVSPDALIARENIARYRADPSALTVLPDDDFWSRDSYGDPEVDLNYLFSLSNDAVPELVHVLPLLEPEQRNWSMLQFKAMHQQLSEDATRDGWPGWHLSRIQAQLTLMLALKGG